MNDPDRIWTIIGLLAVATAILFGVLTWRTYARRAQLRRHFGPEYERTVEVLGRTTLAEHELEERARRVESFRFRDLSGADRARFAAKWNDIQANFATDPAVAVTATNELINEVMRARGYPTLCFEERVADLSVEHPGVVEHYRAAHELSRSIYNGVVDTELLRQALVHYRILFTHLLPDARGISAPPAPIRDVSALWHRAAASKG